MEEKTIKKIVKKTVKTEEKKSKPEGKLLVIIRITGQVNLRPGVNECLYRLRLRRKFACVLMNSDNRDTMGMLEQVKFFVAYGNISKETLAKLINARGQKVDGKKFNGEDVAEELMNGKSLSDLGFKPFFRLHPPRKGIHSKLQYPKGVLGNHKDDINKLVERML